MPHFLTSRPRHGACYLDFVDVWLHIAVSAQDAEAAGQYARELTHWALLMHPELAPLPHNVVLGEN